MGVPFLFFIGTFYVSVFTPAESGKANHWAVLMKNKSGTLKKRKKIKNKPEKEKKKEKRQSELKIIKNKLEKEKKKEKKKSTSFWQQTPRTVYVSAKKFYAHRE